MEGAVEGDDVASSEELLEVLDTAGLDGSLGLSRERLVVVCRYSSSVVVRQISKSPVQLTVEQLLAVEGKEPLEDTVTDTSSSNGSDNLALEVVGVLGDACDVPDLGVDGLGVCGHKVPHEEEDGHENVLSDAIRAGHQLQLRAREVGGRTRRRWSP